ncbi:PstS family phosphate ABC transporter substrate-binding protein [Acaryochloris marina]|uniref:PstS family phosphate ABC transporter substrate-binding protein n=1 Tax=Acaryochloris marina TaxID=155978 RepID=UPI001BAF9197|nr:substrate-binding domain-containing protein [Acaryochloris marina]QUY40587.1 substrate-binding domain-containing protein [Acaryochloris marina S15]
MNPLKNPKQNRDLVLPGMIAVGLVWSVGLLGFGIWQNLQTSQQKGEQPQSSTLESVSDDSTFTQVNPVPSGRFRYSGSPDWSSIRLVVDSAIQSERREYQLSYVQPSDQPANSVTAIALLLQDKLDFVQSDRPLRPDEIKQAQENGIELKQVPVATDGIAIATHPSLSIPGLTLQELADIYQGKITNWQQVGGPNLDIQPLSLSVGSVGSVDLFLSKVMQGQSFSKTIDYSPNMTAALRKLAESPGGILFGSSAEIIPQCSVKPLPLGKEPQQWIAPYQSPYVLSQDCPNQRNRINSTAFLSQEYPLTHPLYVIYPHNSSPAGEAYTQLLLSNQGQELLVKAGFVQLSPSSQP